MKNERDNIQSSILDRLIDSDPGVTRESVQRRFLSLSQSRDTVARDLERMLNSKRLITPVPDAYKEVSNSLLLYGLRDFTSLNPASPAVKQQLSREIADAIAKFEPRLKSLKVNLESTTQKTLMFRITAMLILEPVYEPISFDTYFDLNKGEYLIQR